MDKDLEKQREIEIAKAMEMEIQIQLALLDFQKEEKSEVQQAIEQETVADPRTKQERIETYLSDKQKGHKFKDSAYAEGTKKAKIAYNMITAQDIDDIEKDPSMAYDLVQKDKVWEPYDIEAQKNAGVSSGTCFMKVEIRKALNKRPFDSPEARKLYVKNLENLQVAIENVTDLDSLDDVTYEWTNKLDLGDLKAVYGEKESRVSWWSESRVKTHKAKGIFGQSFLNLCRRGSESAGKKWYKARKFEAVTDEMSQKAINKQKRMYVLRIDRYDFLLKQISLLQTSNELKSFVNRNFSGKFHAYTDTFEGNREYYKKIIERWVKESESALEGISVDKSLEAKEDDWSWTDVTIKKGEKKGRRINQKEPLSYIKRTGGLQITVSSEQDIIDMFDFSKVLYGTSLPDKEKEPHSRYFLGAMSDMAEILNFDLKAMNRLGGLEIHFATSGSGGHAATYYPAYKKINLTRRGGDGSVAHEWAHYLDNVLSEHTTRRGKYTMATEGHIENYKLKEIIGELLEYFKKGNPDVRPTITEVISIDKSAPEKEYRIYADNIDDAIKEVQADESFRRFSQYQKKLSVYNVYQYLLRKFEKETYTVQFELDTSYYKYYSAQYGGTAYWTSNDEMFARAFENYVLKKLLDAGRDNNYLVSGYKYGTVGYPYPYGTEAEDIAKIFDRLMLAIKEELNIGDFVPHTNIRQDEYIDLGSGDKKTLEKKDEEGIVVNK